MNLLAPAMQGPMKGLIPIVSMLVHTEDADLDNIALGRPSWPFGHVEAPPSSLGIRKTQLLNFLKP